MSSNSAFDTLQFAIDHGVKTVTYTDEPMEVIAEIPVVSFNPKAPAGQRFRFDVKRDDEIQAFKDKIAETKRIIENILK